MGLPRSNRDINQKDAIASYEFTLMPRALCAPDGTVLPCQDKSTLIHLLIKLAKDEESQAACMDYQDAMETRSSNSPRRKIGLVDGMVLVQRLTKKPAAVVIVEDLRVCFNDRFMSRTQDFDKIVLVFHTYRAVFFQIATREKQRDGKAPVQYQVRDDTSIKPILMNWFLSHDNTKADLISCLASKTLECNMESPKLIIMSVSGHIRSNKDLHFEDNNHEKANTLLINHAILTSQKNPLTLSWSSYHLTQTMTSWCWSQQTTTCY